MVINQTEALVSIDINSGKATREHNIEDTALKTNLEATDEIARQLRLRDLAGLIVIDYIDMEEKRNNRSVERRLKEALKNDRARIQVGRISHFGLLEMSRQRLRPSLLEGSTKVCPHCEGRGIVRSISSCALTVLRSIEEHLISKKTENLTVKCHPEVAFYILNDKRDHLLSLETEYGVSIFISPSGEVKTSQAIIERGGERLVPIRRPVGMPVKIDSAFEQEDEAAAEDAPAEEAGAEVPVMAGDGDGRDEDRQGAKRRRRGRRGGRRGGREGSGRGGAVAAGEAPDPGDQPTIKDEETEDSQRPAEFVSEGSEDGEGDVRAASGEREERQDRGRGRGRGRNRRDRWGRDRGRGQRMEEDAGRGGADAAPGPEQPPSEVRKPVERVEPAPVPAPASEAAPQPEPEPRKWQPPARTVPVAPGERKAGWWSRRG
jgi:ribonuclease E